MRNILDYIEKIKSENEGPRITVQEPRNMNQASLADDLEPGPLKDEMLKGFDPSQETHEEYLQRINLERPFNMNQGGRIGFARGSPGADMQEILNAYKEYKRSHHRGKRRSPIIPFKKYFEIYAEENMAEGGRAGYNDGQLVTPNVDGSRPGYKGDEAPIGSEIRKITDKNHPHYGKWAYRVVEDGKRVLKYSDIKPKLPDKSPKHPYVNNKDFQIFFEEYKKTNPDWNPKKGYAAVLDKYERTLAKKNKIVGIPELVEALGENSPYSKQTIIKVFTDSKKKITKNMSQREKAAIKNLKRINKIFEDIIGTPSKFSDVTKEYKYIRTFEGKGSSQATWDFNPSKIKKLNKALNKYYNQVGDLQESTVDNMFRFLNNENLMKEIIKYKGGPLSQDSFIFKSILKEYKGGKDPSYSLMQLGRALRGEIQIEGIDKNLRLGNRLIKLTADNYRSPLGNSFLHWAKLQMGKHFDDPNATYKSLTNSIRNSMKEVGIKNSNLHIDEIFPARTGQLTIGKGSGAYNQVVQLINGKINSKEKATFDSQASTRYQNIIKNIKDKNWDEVNRLVKDHDTAIKEFYEKNPQAKGKVKLTQLNYDPVKKRFASPTEIYGKDVFPSKIQKDMDKFYRKTGLSLDVGSTMTLEKVAKDPKTLHKFLKQAGFKIDKCLSSGGRVKLKGGKGVNTCIREVIEEEQKKGLKGNKISLEKFGKFGKLAKTAGWLLGPIDIPIELGFALPHMLAGDKEAAKRATTLGLFGWGKDKIDEIKAGSPESYKYLKHLKDNQEYINTWFENQDLNEDLVDLKKEQYNIIERPSIPRDRKELALKQRNDLENKIKATEDKMNFIAENYKGYYDEEGKFDVWGEAKGKSALQDYLIKDVIEKTDKGLDMKQYGGHGMNIAWGLPWNFAMKPGEVAPFKGGQPITNLKQHIAQRGQPYWKQLEHATYEAGIPKLFDHYFATADVRDPRDAYSDLPIKYASQLGKMEAEETRRMLAEKKAKEEMDEAARKYGPYTRFAGGGIAGIRKPSAIPPESGPQSQGLAYLKKYGSYY